MGSSPHARGALAKLCDVVRVAGIIPACAGSTLILIRALRVCMDHPRMRGEHESLSRRITVSWGSSPHARGALPFLIAHIFKLGIIPACTGSTTVRPGRSRTGRDHLRMRGEHMADAYKGLHIRGSSPYTRGARKQLDSVSIAPGIIPACAGSTLFPFLFLFRLRDHPRMRGEHL